jgi:hypothetical protein
LFLRCEALIPKKTPTPTPARTTRQHKQASNQEARIMTAS